MASKISKEHREILEYLVEGYSGESVIGALNEIEFNRTGGATTHGLRGAVQSIPSFALSAVISLPLTLLAAIGALSHRAQKRWDDKNSIRNRLRPAFWTDFLANPRDAGAIRGDLKKMLLGGVAGAAAAGGIKSFIAGKSSGDSSAGVIDSSTIENITVEDAKDLSFREYWVTFSNGEIVRFRADSEELARLFANKYATLTKDRYDIMNSEILSGYVRYTFYFDDGEVVQCSGNPRGDKKELVKEVTQSRKALTDVMNNANNGTIKLQNLAVPKVVKVVSKKNTKIEYPEPGKYEISTIQPNTYESLNVKVPKLVYKNGSLSQFKAVYKQYGINIPSPDYNTAITVVNKLVTSDEAQRNLSNFIKGKTPYRILMGDGDIYNIAAGTVYEARELAVKFAEQKEMIINSYLGGIDKDSYYNIMQEYGEAIKSVKGGEVNLGYKIPTSDECRISRIIDEKTKDAPQKFTISR